MPNYFVLKREMPSPVVSGCGLVPSENTLKTHARPSVRVYGGLGGIAVNQTNVQLSAIEDVWASLCTTQSTVHGNIQTLSDANASRVQYPTHTASDGA